MASQTRSTLDPIFVPVDVSLPGQRAVFQAQRVICGWKFNDEMLDTMFEQARKAERFLFWVCIPLSRAWEGNSTLLQDWGSSLLSMGTPVNGATEGFAQTDRWLLVSKDGTRVLKFSGHSVSEDFGGDVIALPLFQASSGVPEERLEDGTTGVSGQTDLLVPVGHISLDLKDLEARPAPLLGSGDGSTVAITTLFILPAYRKHGLATTSMRHAEGMIRGGSVSFSVSMPDTSSNDRTINLPSTVSTVESDIVIPKLQKCKTIALTTLAERHFITPEFTNRHNYLGPWYSKLGYQKIMEMPKFSDSGLGNDTDIENLLWAEIWTKEL